ncbi:hypothetical protein HMPREF0972_01341 [Actinomyces sp. oral taxon 848 str. F0332]|nr:hypothetical protein HMPREF0972_01341 [Actinomyces sp. oral taxon 848 str. F0332]
MRKPPGRAKAGKVRENRQGTTTAAHGGEGPPARREKERE